MHRLCLISCGYSFEVLLHSFLAGFIIVFSWLQLLFHPEFSSIFLLVYFRIKFSISILFLVHLVIFTRVCVCIYRYIVSLAKIDRAKKMIYSNIPISRSINFLDSR